MFLQCLLTSLSCFNVFLQGLLNTVYGNVVFSRSRMQARHKSLVFFRSLSICSCSLRLCKALVGFWYWKSLGWFERFWKVLQALRGFVRLLAVLKCFERLWDILSGFRGLDGCYCALGGFGFGRLWEAFAKTKNLSLIHI